MLRESNFQRLEDHTRDDFKIAYRSPPVVGYDAKRAVGPHHAEILEAIRRVLDSGSLILGPEVTAFENEFAQFVGCRHAIGMASGTDALIVAMKALGVGPGDEVITVANGPVPTVAAICAVGATPCFVDVDHHSLQMDVDQLRTAICRKTKCVIPIHLYGFASHVEEIVHVCRNHNLFLIEDCAQAHGTLYGGKHVGGFGDIGCFSFYPTKNLGALGDAGICVTNDPRLDERLRELAQYGFRGAERIAYSNGLNSRLDAIQAAILRTLLPNLRNKIHRKREIAKFYQTQLANTPLTLPVEPPLVASSWHQYVVRCRQRKRMLEHLSKHSIFAGVHYEWPVHTMPAFANNCVVASSMTATMTACEQVLSLPIQPELTANESCRIVDAIHGALREGID